MIFEEKIEVRLNALISTQKVDGLSNREQAIRCALSSVADFSPLCAQRVCAPSTYFEVASVSVSATRSWKFQV